VIRTFRWRAAWLLLGVSGAGPEWSPAREGNGAEPGLWALERREDRVWIEPLLPVNTAPRDGGGLPAGRAVCPAKDAVKYSKPAFVF
jgi:hypothetical protein